jgi:hypothetical protein
MHWGHFRPLGFRLTVTRRSSVGWEPSLSGLATTRFRKVISLVVLNIGCALRVLSEIPAYEAKLHVAWRVLEGVMRICTEPPVFDRALADAVKSHSC